MFKLFLREFFRPLKKPLTIAAAVILYFVVLFILMLFIDIILRICVVLIVLTVIVLLYQYTRDAWARAKEKHVRNLD